MIEVVSLQLHATRTGKRVVQLPKPPPTPRVREAPGAGGPPVPCPEPGGPVPGLRGAPIKACARPRLVANQESRRLAVGHVPGQQPLHLGDERLG